MLVSERISAFYNTMESFNNLTGEDDTTVWKIGNKGVFSVNSAYKDLIILQIGEELLTLAIPKALIMPAQQSPTQPPGGYKHNKQEREKAAIIMSGKYYGKGGEMEDCPSMYMVDSMEKRNQRFNSQPRQTLGDFFPSVLALVDRVTWYLLLVGGASWIFPLRAMGFEACTGHRHAPGQMTRPKSLAPALWGCDLQCTLRPLQCFTNAMLDQSRDHRCVFLKRCTALLRRLCPNLVISLQHRWLARDPSVLHRVGHVLLHMPSVEPKRTRYFVIADDLFQLCMVPKQKTVYVVTKVIEKLPGYQTPRHLNLGQYIASNVPSLKGFIDQSTIQQNGMSTLGALSSVMFLLQSVRFTGKNFLSWEFQFQLFVTEKELWGHIDGADPAPTDPTKLGEWKIKDGRVMTWLLGSINPLIVSNLRPYKTAKAMELLREEQRYVTQNAFRRGNDVAAAFAAQAINGYTLENSSSGPSGPSGQVLTPEMVQQVIVSAFSALGLQGVYRKPPLYLTHRLRSLLLTRSSASVSHLLYPPGFYLYGDSLFLRSSLFARFWGAGNLI
ncbi:hypothetical protein FXO37_13984 [Capsicum annuum]|nr:hypothetical protein FXO37_13984 [Capsicum annuum]